MRRVVWSVLTGLGAFFIVLAIMSWLYVPGQAVKFPLNEYSVSTLVANNASWFSPKSVSELSGVTLKITSTVKGDVTAANSLGSSKYAVWQSFAVVEDTTDHQQVSIPAAADDFAFDRRTGELINWSGNQIDGKPVKQVSGQGYVWPLGAKKQSYQVYDTTLQKPVTFKYAGTATTSGIATYKYVAVVPPTQTGTQVLPGALVGENAPTVTLPQFDSATETYFVDPVTGAAIQVERNTKNVLQDSSGATKLVLLSADFKSSAASIAATVKSDNHYRNLINLATFIIPVVAGLVGIILLVVGLVLSRMSPEDEEYEDEDEPVGASA
jgi:Porin PorA